MEHARKLIRASKTIMEIEWIHASEVLTVGTPRAAEGTPYFWALTVSVVFS